MTSNVRNEVVSLASLDKDLPESTSLLEVSGVLTSSPVEGGGGTNPLLVSVRSGGGVGVSNGSAGSGVVGESTKVTVDSGRTITLEGVESVVGAVDRDLLVVDTESVSLGIGVREETSLEDRVGRGLDTRDEVGRRESSLLNLSEVVLGVLVKSPLTDLAERVVSMGPDLGKIEDAEGSSLSLLGGHGLDVQSPRGEVTLLDALEQILLSVVGVLTRELGGLIGSHGLDTLVSEEVELDVVELAVLVDPLEGVAGVTVHVAVRSGSTTVREQGHDLVDSLLVVGEVVPDHVGVLKVGLGVTLLGVDEDGELGGVSDEENRSVVTDEVVVSLLGVELDRETTGISGSIGGTLLTTDGGETADSLGLGANALEEVGAGQVGDIVSDLEDTVSTGTLGVDNTLGNSLTVEVSKDVNEVEVLEQKRTMLANALGSTGVGDGGTVRSSVLRHD